MDTFCFEDVCTVLLLSAGSNAVTSRVTRYYLPEVTLQVTSYFYQRK